MAFTPSVYERKFYLNGFPKAGLHLLDLLMRPLAMPMPEDPRWMTPWAGMYRGHSWTTEITPMSIITFRIGRVQDGRFMKGHLGHYTDLADYMRALGIIKILIVRDFRDVAVSTAYHIKNPDPEQFAHPAKDILKDKDMDYVLSAVINGIRVPDGFYCPGIMQRWAGYANWLDESWVHVVKYEDLHRDMHGESKKIIQYMLERIGSIFDKKAEIADDVVNALADAMVKTGNETHISPTFRKGAVGDWKEHFNSEHVDAFKDADAEEWLEQLDYVADNDW